MISIIFADDRFHKFGQTESSENGAAWGAHELTVSGNFRSGVQILYSGNDCWFKTVLDTVSQFVSFVCYKNKHLAFIYFLVGRCPQETTASTAPGMLNPSICQEQHASAWSNSINSLKRTFTFIQNLTHSRSYGYKRSRETSISLRICTSHSARQPVGGSTATLWEMMHKPSDPVFGRPIRTQQPSSRRDSFPLFLLF